MGHILINDPNPRMIPFGEIITLHEIKSLRAAVRTKEERKTIHETVMDWVNARPEILERWRKLELLPAYAAYLLEYHLQLKI